MPRFVLSFEKEEQEGWEICRLDSCEQKGKTVEELFSLLMAKAPTEK